jgi:hypothetical protein
METIMKITVPKEQVNFWSNVKLWIKLREKERLDVWNMETSWKNSGCKFYTEITQGTNGNMER